MSGAKTPPEGEYLTPVEVAALLKVSRNTVHRLIEYGDLEALRIYRTVRIPRAALNSFIAKHQATARVS